jgi:hypothetical protein
MPVDDRADARREAPVTSKQEAEKVWEPKFIAEIVSGKDPRVPIEREAKFERPTTVADLLKLYRTRYVEVEPLKSRAGMLSQLNVLTAQLGTLPATALERPDAIEDFKKRYANSAIATTNRYLARLRHVCNWAIGRDLLTKTAFHPRGVRIPAKAERRQERRPEARNNGSGGVQAPTSPLQHGEADWDDVHGSDGAQAGIEQGTSRQRQISRRCAARSSAVTSGIRRAS